MTRSTTSSGSGLRTRETAASKARPKLRLKDVTLCAADTIHAELAARALDISVSRVEFADAVLFSDVNVQGPFRSALIEPLRSTDDYSRFCLHELASRIETKFVLIARWDGYVL